ncbi:MAG TPA: hypothetical protein VGG25_30425 [Streptosporangiaceae bacterium]|jgi:acyl carrier protein
MTVEPARGQASALVLAALPAILAEVTGESAQWTAAVAPDSRLETDLDIESVELTALSLALARAYGDEVDLAGYVAGLGIDEILALTVADVAAYVAGAAGAPATGARG